MHTNILAAPRQEETPIGLGQPSASHKQKQERKKMCRLVIVQCGVRLRTDM